MRVKVNEHRPQREPMSQEPISIKGLSKAKVLAALYNRAKPQGMGFFHYTPEKMSEAEAQQLLDAGLTYFDYMKGRVMKVDLKGDEFAPDMFDRDNGHGEAARIIDFLRSQEQTA